MGYHVHILRTESGQPRPITQDEVRQAIEPMAGRLEIVPDKPEFWLYQPALGEESEIVVFDDSGGELWATNPSDPLLELMIELAGYLGARVRGDEYETYRSLDDTYIHPDDQALRNANYPPAQRGFMGSPFVREMGGRLAISAGVAFVALTIVYLYRYLTAST
jgi:hypothetical protein